MSNMTITGVGTVAEGAYEKITISGTGKLEGTVTCEKLGISGSAAANGAVTVAEQATVSGSFQGTSLHCGRFFGSGSTMLKEELRCREAKASGIVRVGGDLSVEQDCGIAGALTVGGGCEVKGSCKVSGGLKTDRQITVGKLQVSGGLHCGGKVHGEEIRVSGGAVTGGDIEGETIEISGGVQCRGTINGEKITLSGRGAAESVGGSSIWIGNGADEMLEKIFGSKIAETISEILNSLPFNGNGIRFRASGSIEGDDIHLERTAAATVSGARIYIGEYCEIDRVCYSESCVVEDNARVGSVEQI